MTTPFVGEIRMFGFPRIPLGWLACDGSLQSISQNQVLYTLLGTTYGGDGINTFGLPDLRGSTPLHQGTGPGGLTPRVLGSSGGTEQVTLTVQQIPAHTHGFVASSQAATASTPGNTVTLATDPNGQPYFTPTTGATPTPMSTNTGQLMGGNLPHDNCAPTLTVNICIASEGIFPTQG